MVSLTSESFSSSLGSSSVSSDEVFESVLISLYGSERNILFSYKAKVWMTQVYRDARPLGHP